MPFLIYGLFFGGLIGAALDRATRDRDRLAELKVEQEAEEEERRIAWRARRAGGLCTDRCSECPGDHFSRPFCVRPDGHHGDDRCQCEAHKKLAELTGRS